ncbi:PAAR-like protein [Flavobacterium artemisiae]|uniref:PAAR-like protein n=1 Tax=Flavobacterium artemisiae TaxID=2126556 RepID=A0ABW4HL16_9FLAO
MAKPDNTLKRKEREEKEEAEDGLKFVIDGAKIKCDLCTAPDGEVKVSFDPPTIQDKKVVTVVEKDMSSLMFKGNCKKSPNQASPCASVMKLGDWKDVGTVYFQDQFPLLLKSTVKCDYGGTAIKITDCGQRNEVEKVDTTGAPVPPLEKVEVDFIVKFRTLSSYDGEFGFDWMRDEYLEGICIEGLENLKKVYSNIDGSPLKINNEDYYVPWLSMFKGHKNRVGIDVKLKLSIELKKNALDDTDTILLQSPKGIEISPNVLKAKEASNIEILIKCNEDLNADVVIEAFDQNNRIVGKLNVLKNAVKYDLPIKFLIIDEINPSKSYYSKVFDAFDDAFFLDLKNTLTINSLNQALINPTFEDGSVAEIDFLKIDFEDFKNRKLVDIPEGLSQPRFPKDNNLLKDELIKLAKEKNKNFKGIFVFMTVFHQKGDEAGFSWTYPRNNQAVVIGTGGINSKTTYLHEIGHCLGLEHVFDKKDTQNISIVENNIKIHENNIKIFENNITVKQEFLKQFKNKLSSEVIKFKDGTNKSVLEIRKEQQKAIDEQNEKIENENKELNDSIRDLEDRLRLVNLCVFEQGTTDNIMDYMVKIDKITPNPNQRKAFFKWHWDLMQEETIKYYN